MKLTSRLERHLGHAKSAVVCSRTDNSVASVEDRTKQGNLWPSKNAKTGGGGEGGHLNIRNTADMSEVILH